ncbi:MAG: alpha-amylase family glycosyl hydrolase [Anaerolineales bacterium]|nr:alpha-amylase family glycosyl hydrolase [Anaerolineales bacterium]
MYPSPLCDDGYDIADHFGIHPDYGTPDDFKTLLQEAYARGLKVITDLVLNPPRSPSATPQPADGWMRCTTSRRRRRR